MSSVRTTGTAASLDGRPALRFERRLGSSPERVWQAITDPTEVAAWFPSVVTWTPSAGETFEIDGQPGTIAELERPRLFAWASGEERYHNELRPDGEGCVYIFTHAYDPKAGSIVQYASGWETYLNRLEVHLAGGYLSEEDAHAVAPQLQERYTKLFGNESPDNTGIDAKSARAE
ncbi:SRPBCC domain-containing protein [Micromonospora sp. NPDC005324]|uniref:SRPBCC domain-containing protein n=1 Tax=Micromonospora sp. NPDC005324 TaxID=3157033 RepID=UPI0033AE7AD0